MDNINYTSFKAFVMAQDESRVINHQEWETCSVGDYALHVTGDRELNLFNRVKLLDNDNDLYHELNNGCSDTMPTYKELQLLLTDYEEDTL
mgnify:CR=1 FL=1